MVVRKIIFLLSKTRINATARFNALADALVMRFAVRSVSAVFAPAAALCFLARFGLVVGFLFGADYIPVFCSVDNAPFAHAGFALVGIPVSAIRSLAVFAEWF
jgi:hypothetical protein